VGSGQWAQAESVLSEAGKNPMGKGKKKGKHMKETTQQSHSQANRSIRSVVFILSYLPLLTFSLYPLTHSLSLLHLLRITKRVCACIQASVPGLVLSRRGLPNLPSFFSSSPFVSDRVTLRYLTLLEGTTSTLT
jgi:hypothetical protein